MEVVGNPAATYKHGAGPIVVKMLTEMSVTVVASSELGLGASSLLEQNKIDRIKVKASITAKEAVHKTIQGISGQAYA